MMGSTRAGRRYWLVMGLTALVFIEIGMSSLLARTLSPVTDDFPKNKQDAIQRYEVDIQLKDWLKGPVEYILLREERETWKKLKTDSERREFIDWFWNRRDEDQRVETNEFRDNFYDQVAESNKRFFGFPRGWRSDRGRVWSILGRPNSIRLQSLNGFGRCSYPDGVMWTYSTTSTNRAYSSAFGEFYVWFVESRPGQYDLCDTMLGLGAWPRALRMAIEYSNDAAVVDPTTEFEPGRGVMAGSPVARAEPASRPLEFEVPLSAVTTLDAAGAAVLPLDLALRDIAFRSNGDRLSADLQVDLELTPVNTGLTLRQSRRWTLNFSEEELMSAGAATLRSALVVDVDPGEYTVVIQAALLATGAVGSWKGTIVVARSGISIGPLGVGSRILNLNAAGTSQGILIRDLEPLEVGGYLLAMAWITGPQPMIEDITLSLIDGLGEETSLPIESVRLVSSLGGPLVVKGDLARVDPGRYTVRVSGGGELSATAEILVR